MSVANEIIYSSFFNHECDIALYIEDLENLKRLINSEKNSVPLIKDTVLTFSQHLMARGYGGGLLFNQKRENYKYISVDESPLIYISQFLAHSKINKKTFNKMIDIPLEHFQSYRKDVEGSGDLIHPEAVDSILNLPTMKSSLTFISQNSTILILNFNYTEVKNSVAFPYLGMIINSRYNPNNEEDSAPEYIFMHEMGHLFHHYFVPGCESVPDSFGDVIKYAFRNDIQTLSKETLQEMYADCFSIACSYGTLYEDTNPFFKLFRREDCAYITNYFYTLINNELEKLDNN